MLTLTQNQSPAFRWVRQHLAACGPFETWVRSLGPTATCLDMWRACQDVAMLNEITYWLRTWDNYKPVRLWLAQQKATPTADQFRAKCAELGCYSKE